jgi:iron complex outermembrane receptor protein
MDGKLSWLVAGYYGAADSTQALTLRAFGDLSTAHQRSKRETVAIFGHADYQLTPQWEASVGVRRSSDRTEHSYSLREPGPLRPPIVAVESRRFRNTSFEAGTRYQFTDDKMVFARYAEGYRAGGFVGLPTSVANAAPYDPEYSTSYEAGAKTDWLDGRLRLNLTLFTTKFDDLQRDIVRRNPDGTFTEVTQNAASARTRGVELESIIRPVENLTIWANIGYLDAKYLSYQTLNGSGVPIDLSNRPLLLAPKNTGSVEAEYRFSLENSAFALFEGGDVRVGVDWRSAATFSASDDPIGYQKGYAVVNAALTLRSARGFKVSAYVENVFDTYFKTGGETVGGLFRFVSDDIGRTAGIVLEKSF